LKQKVGGQKFNKEEKEIQRKARGKKSNKKRKKSKEEKKNNLVKMEKKFKEKKIENKKRIVSSHHNVIVTKIIYEYVNISQSPKKVCTHHLSIKAFWTI